MSFLTHVLKKSAFADRFNGAAVCTCAAFDAGIGINNILSVAFADCAYGATVCTCAARNAVAADNICHCSYLLILSENASENLRVAFLVLYIVS